MVSLTNHTQPQASHQDVTPVSPQNIHSSQPLNVLTQQQIEQRFQNTISVCITLRQNLGSFIFRKSLTITIKNINCIIVVIKKTFNFSKISPSIHLAHVFYECYSFSKILCQNFQVQNSMFIYSIDRQIDDRYRHTAYRYIYLHNFMCYMYFIYNIYYSEENISSFQNSRFGMILAS